MKANWLKIAVGVLAVAVIALVVVMVVGPRGQAEREVLRVATTTSLYDTGLWDALENVFEKEYNADLQITAVGTGNALKLGQTGDADVVAVHDPAQEAAFIDGGYAVEAANFSSERVTWAYN